MLQSFKRPKNNEKYIWTHHVVGKMMFYGIPESRVKRVIRSPKRVEEGIAPNTIAVMQPASSRRAKEYWVMYQKYGKRLKIITAWIYPGVSPVRGEIPIPAEIRRELAEIL